jgi:hypothetical protein
MLPLPVLKNRKVRLEEVDRQSSVRKQFVHRVKELDTEMALLKELLKRAEKIAL